MNEFSIPVGLAICLAVFFWSRYRWGSLQKANQKLDEGKFDEAITCAEVSIKRHPRDPVPLSVLAAAYYGLREYEKALEVYEKARTFKENSPEIYCGLCSTKMMLGDAAGALSAAQKALSLRRDHHTLMMRAWAFELSFKHEEAIADCDAIQKMHPQGVPQSFLVRGQAYYGIKDFERAEENYSELLKFSKAGDGNKIVATALSGLFLIHFARRNWDKAEEELSRARQLNPDSATSYLNQAILYCTRKQPELALEQLERAGELANERFEKAYILSNKGRALLMLKDVPAASKLVEEALCLWQHPGLLCSRVAISLTHGETEKAKVDAENALELDRHNVEAQWFMSRVLKAQGKDEEAKELEEKAIANGYTPYLCES